MSFRRASRILQATECAGHDFSPLDGWHDEAKTIRRAREIVLAISETNRGGGGVGDSFQFHGGSAGKLREQVATVKCRRGEYDGVGFENLIAVDSDRPVTLVVIAMQCRRWGTQSDRTFGKASS